MTALEVAEGIGRPRERPLATRRLRRCCTGSAPRGFGRPRWGIAYLEEFALLDAECAADRFDCAACVAMKQCTAFVALGDRQAWHAVLVGWTTSHPAVSVGSIAPWMRESIRPRGRKWQWYSPWFTSLPSGVRPRPSHAAHQARREQFDRPRTGASPHTARGHRGAGCAPAYRPLGGHQAPPDDHVACAPSSRSCRIRRCDAGDRESLRLSHRL